MDRRRAPCPSFPARDVSMNAPARPAAIRARQVIRGLYAITPDWDDTEALARAVEASLGAGTRLLQYRNKPASPGKKREQLLALMPPCERHYCTLVVNDDWRLALDLGLDAVHIGSDDGEARLVRDAVGPEVILGVSCYGDLARARALAPYADYLAFGSVFASSTKPAAVAAALEVLQEARALGRPVVAIGGIDAANAGQVLAAGADAVAVIRGVFGGESVARATSALLRVVEKARARSTS